MFKIIKETHSSAGHCGIWKTHKMVKKICKKKIESDHVLFGILLLLLCYFKFFFYCTSHFSIINLNYKFYSSCVLFIKILYFLILYLYFIYRFVRSTEIYQEILLVVGLSSAVFVILKPFKTKRHPLSLSYLKDLWNDYRFENQSFCTSYFLHIVLYYVKNT